MLRDGSTKIAICKEPCAVLVFSIGVLYFGNDGSCIATMSISKYARTAEHLALAVCQ